MLIVDSQIHIWENGKMSAHHRQIPTYDVDDALAEMTSAGVDAAVLHPPSTLGEAVNVQAVEAVKAHPDKFCHPRPFRPRGAEQGRDRPQLALAARDGRLSLHLQPAAPEALLDRRLARMVLEARARSRAIRRTARRRHTWRSSARSPSAIPASRSISTISAGTAAAPAAPTTRPGPISADMLALAKLPNVGVKMSGAPSYSSHPYPYKNIHGYLQQHLRRIRPRAAASGAPTSPACRAAIANA